MEEIAPVFPKFFRVGATRLPPAVGPAPVRWGGRVRIRHAALCGGTPDVVGRCPARGTGRRRRISLPPAVVVDARRMPSDARDVDVVAAQAQQRRSAGMMGMDGVTGMEDDERFGTIVLNGRPSIDDGRGSMAMTMMMPGFPLFRVACPVIVVIAVVLPTLVAGVVAYGYDDGIPERVAVFPTRRRRSMRRGGRRRRRRADQRRSVVEDRRAIVRTCKRRRERVVRGSWAHRAPVVDRGAVPPPPLHPLSSRCVMEYVMGVGE